MRSSIDKKTQNDLFTFKYGAEFSTHPLYPQTIWVQSKIKATLNNAKEPDKDIVFVLDRSVSMRGSRLDLVKKAVQKFIKDALEENDTFHIISFDARGKIELANIKKSNLNQKILLNEKMLTPLEIINNIEVEHGGTHAENGLALIGKPLSEMGNDFVTVNDVNNTFIILLTDGVNRSQHFEEPAKQALAARCGGSPCLIPIGVSSESNLQSLEKLSSIKEKIYIRAYSDSSKIPQGYHADEEVNAAFEIAAKKIRQRTGEIHLSLFFGEHVFTANVGCLSHNQELSHVAACIKKTGEVSVSVGSQLTDAALTLSKNMDEVKIDRDVLAAYALQQLIETNKLINQKNKYCEFYTNEIANKLLPLLSPEEITDSLFVKQVRGGILSTLNVYKTMDKEDLRSTLSNATYMAAGLRTEWGLNIISNNRNNFDIHHNSFKIEGKSYVLAGQNVNYVDYVKEGSQPLISIDPALSLHSALIINPANIKKLPQYEALRKVLMERAGYTPILKPGAPRIINTLLALASQIQTIFPDDKIDDIVDDAKKVQVNDDLSLPCFNLENFIANGKGICRHIAPFTAICIAGLLQDKKLPPGTVRQFRGTSTSGELAHTWVIYSPNKKSGGLFSVDQPEVGGPFLVDVTNIKFGGKAVYDLADKLQRHLACQDYANRGLKGVLDACLSTLKFTDHLPAVIDDKLLNDVKDEEEFEKAGLICPISNTIPKDPVNIHGQPKTHYFDRDYIHEWLKRKQVNPFTNQPCSNILIPAIKIRDEIVLMITRQKKIIPPETATAGSKLPLEQGVDRGEDVLKKVDAKLKVLGTIIPIDFNVCNKAGIRESIGVAAAEQIKKLTKSSADCAVPSVLLSDKKELEFYFKDARHAECLKNYLTALGFSSHYMLTILVPSFSNEIKAHGPFTTKLVISSIEENREYIVNVCPFDDSYVRGLYLVSGQGFSYYQQANIFEQLKLKLNLYAKNLHREMQCTRLNTFNANAEELSNYQIILALIREIEDILKTGKLVNQFTYPLDERLLNSISQILGKASIADENQIKCMDYILNQGKVPAFTLDQTLQKPDLNLKKSKL